VLGEAGIDFVKDDELQADGPHCPFDERVRVKLPMRAQKTHLAAIVHALEVQAPADKTSLAAILEEVAEAYPPRGMMVLVSDLLVEREGLFRGLRLLRQRGNDVMVLHVMDDDELDFPFNGPTRFEGLEMPLDLSCNPRALREGYLASLQKYLDEVRRGCAKNAVDYALIRTSQSLDAALASYLTNRLGMHQRN